MSCPRLEIDYGKIQHNATILVQRLAKRGISVTGVTKVSLGSPRIAEALLGGGVSALGDTHIESLEDMHQAGVKAPMTLLRSPMLSQVIRVVEHADVSFNTELDVISELSSAARQAERQHGIVLMVELGDLREGILPGKLLGTVERMLRLPNLVLRGLGSNLACRSGVSPDARNMAELSALVGEVEGAFGLELEIISGGNSANLGWALSCEDLGRINNLRLGESILLGRDPLHRQPIDGLHTDAMILVGEVIESKPKPSLPWGTLAQAAFGEAPPVIDRGEIVQTILAFGRQDTDPEGLTPPPGITVLGASSDHLIVDSGGRRQRIGAEIRFELDYSALLRAMTSPFVKQVAKVQSEPASRGMGPEQPQPAFA